MHRRAIPIPDYRDPDAAEAENLIIASRLLQDIGRSQEAKALADQARALFEDAPYNERRQARVLGAASCSPSGTLQCRPGSMDGFYEVASYPYDDRGEAETAARAAAEKRFLKLASDCVRGLGLRWLAAAQLSSALSGKPVRPVRRSLAQAVTALCGAASVAEKASWSGPAAEAFRDLMHKNGILDEPPGTEPMREDARCLSRYHRISADEGSPSEDGGWIP